MLTFTFKRYMNFTIFILLCSNAHKTSGLRKYQTAVDNKALFTFNSIVYARREYIPSLASKVCLVDGKIHKILIVFPIKNVKPSLSNQKRLLYGIEQNLYKLLIFKD
jgi:hypothetical protein